MILTQGEENNIKWKITSDGVLTIEGKGEMLDWESKQNCESPNPWHKANIEKNVKKVVISEGITSVGMRAFDRCVNLEKVELPDSITVIKCRAFAECLELKSINVPEGVKEIGKEAFGGCTALKNICLPISLKIIGSEAFAESGLRSICIPSNITKIECCTFLDCREISEINISKNVEVIEDDFYGCNSLKYINVADENKYFSSVDGVLFNKDKTTLIKYPDGKSDQSYTIPSTVESFENAIRSKHLISLYVTENVIDNLYIYGSPLLERVDVSEKNKYYSSIDGVLFNKAGTQIICYPSNKKGDHYDIPEGVQNMAIAFCNCINLVSVFIPKSMNSICMDGSYAFCDCFNLEKVVVSEESEKYKSVDGVLFSKKSLSLLYYPSRKEDVSYSIPDGIKRIYPRAFPANLYLNSISIPDTMEEIVYNGTFDECRCLCNFEINNNNNFIYSDGILWNIREQKVIWDKKQTIWSI